MKKRLLFWMILIVSLQLTAQFAPAAGKMGTTAINKDSTVIKSWATSCRVQRGYLNIEDTAQTFTQGDSTSNRAFFGRAINATGYPENNVDVVSLGDGGSALLTFKKPITNGEGPDFCVFENGFQAATPPYNYYLELAFVEVSTDGKRFVRFPAVSFTQDTTQIGGFGQINPEKIHNLAGKYQLDYGTPFDLEELADSSGINIDSINYVRIVDVVGDIHVGFASYDSQGHIINDPWPSPFWSCGFDLNAVGVTNELDAPGGLITKETEPCVIAGPVPANKVLKIKSDRQDKLENILLINTTGKVVFNQKADKSSIEIAVESFPRGVYVLIVVSKRGITKRTILINH